MKSYLVTVTVEATATLRVVAASEEEAGEHAKTLMSKWVTHEYSLEHWDAAKPSNARVVKVESPL